jgi:3-deoxy-7-phosphoheptulonate synthase
MTPDDRNIYRQATTDDAPVYNTHVLSFEPLESPNYAKEKLPAGSAVLNTVRQGRAEVRNILAGQDDRLAVVVGPCSIHDTKAAMDYAQRLAALREDLGEELLILMRVYFEKPRTTIGWKGLINDPHFDGSNNIHTGLTIARQLLLDINSLGLPCATEFLDPIIPQYIADLISWTAIGARTTESQTHREMSSGLSMPVGFKNSTDGDLQIAVNAMISARTPQAFLGIDNAGQTSIVRTTGNADVHVVLRGGASGPNYSTEKIAAAHAAMKCGARERRVMVDCSHGNSNKEYARQPEVLANVVEQYCAGQKAIMGVMIESNLVAGNQKIGPSMTYGQSITDACIDWPTTEDALRRAAARLNT